MKDLIESIRQMYQPQAEATMMKNNGEVVHNCAKHVEHAQYGRGATIAEEHADPDRHGNIAWYDVMFEHGIEKGVPVTELNILQSESHGHTTKKAKKMAEAEDLSNPKKNAKMKDDEEDDDENDMEDDKPKKMKKMSEQVVDADLDIELTEEEIAEIAEAYMGFEKTTKALAAKGAKNPKALAAWIGRKKYGKAKFQKAAAAGKSMRGMKAEEIEHDLPEPVDETIIYKTTEYELSEAQKSTGYDAHFRAMMAKHGIKHPGELDTPEKKKAFFNKVDASYKAKNEDVFLEAMMASDLDKIKDAHRKAGNKISNETSGSKAGEAHHSFVVTQPSGKRTRHIYHGSTKRVETMSPAPRSKESSEQDLDDK
jgi:hypothetical protein